MPKNKKTLLNTLKTLLETLKNGKKRADKDKIFRVHCYGYSIIYDTKNRNKIAIKIAKKITRRAAGDLFKVKGGSILLIDCND